MVENNLIRMRPKLSAWLRERSWSQAQAAVALGISEQTVRRICAPFDHADRRRPEEELVAKIIALTDGEVTGEDFIHPALRRGGDAETLRAGRAA